jgi:CheY-like chemotaxis protein
MLNAEILNARILIVDDQEANVMLLEADAASKPATPNVTSTMDPQTRSARCTEHRYDLILLDLQMPEWMASR